MILLGSNGYHLSKPSTQFDASEKCLYHQRLPNQINQSRTYDLKALAASPSSLRLASDESLLEAFKYLEEKTIKIARLMGVRVSESLSDNLERSAKNINKLLDNLINSYSQPSREKAQEWLGSKPIDEIILRKLEYLDQEIVSSFYTDKNTAVKLIYRDDLFPANLKMEKSFQAANKILKILEAQNYYNLPLESVEVDRSLEKQAVKGKSYFIPGIINTKALVQESLNYNQGRRETVINPKTKQTREIRSGLYSAKLDELLKTRFKVLDNQLLPRDSGFEDSLRLYLNNMETYQPTMFKYCYEAAQHLTNIQKPIKNICTITAHQSETNLAAMMGVLNQQDFNKKELSTFIFINGDDKDEIKKRMTELEEFQEKNPNLDIRVFGGIIPKGEWSFGFKALGLNAALISYQMSNLFSPKQEHDSDPAVLFFDADITGMKEGVVNDKLAAIESGAVIEFSEAMESLPRLKEAGINYYLINKIYQIGRANLKLQNEEIFKITDGKKKPSPVSTGHNSTFSGIVIALMGGFKPHVAINEDLNLGSTVDAAFKRTFKEINPKNYISKLPDFRVECDGGAVLRTVDLSRSITHKYRSHDGITGTLIPIANKAEISVKRLEEEVNGVLGFAETIYSKLLLKVPTEVKPVIEEYLDQKKENFYKAINSFIAEEVVPEIKTYNPAYGGIEVKVNRGAGLISLQDRLS